MNKRGFIFDLDGVIVDTAKYHFLAWKNLANSIGVDFTHHQNEQLKGVSRARSLEKILEWGNKQITDEEFQSLMTKKNEEYLTYIEGMDESEILSDVSRVLSFLRRQGQGIALGSASKNAQFILNRVNLTSNFQSIVDGNHVSKAKPDPEVFLIAAKNLNVDPTECVVFEDSVAGVQAANKAGMVSVGIGSPKVLHEADFVFSDFSEMTEAFLTRLIND